MADRKIEIIDGEINKKNWKILVKRN
jgi:hypothetical protein